MNKNQEQLLVCLAHSLFQRQSTVTITQEILEEAKAQAVSSIITCDYQVLGQNIRIINAHADLTRILEEIPFTTFKGYASACYYPNPYNRTMGDVDFIVDSKEYLKCIEKLQEAGYKECNSDHERHKSFINDKIMFELHSEIKGIPNGQDGIPVISPVMEKRVRKLLSDLISTSRTVDTQHGPVVVPDDFHHGLIMLLHVAGHMINDGGVGLRHLCDWAVYVEKVNVEKFRDQLENIGLWTFASQLTAVCTRYLGLPEQSWAGEWDERFLSQLINDILSAGNFGHKEAGRTASMKLKKSSFGEMTKEHYGIVQKYPILLPLFMLIYLTRYGWLVLRGKRRFIKLSTITGVKERDILYKQFRLFEV